MDLHDQIHHNNLYETNYIRVERVLFPQALIHLRIQKIDRDKLPKHILEYVIQL
jgi:hypothetical protein